VDSKKDTSTHGCDIGRTTVHFVPIKRDCTWETKGAKHIHVSMIKDKRQITMVASSSKKGAMLHLQVVFQTTTSRMLPPMNEGRKPYILNGFHITCNVNYWFSKVLIGL